MYNHFMFSFFRIKKNVAPKNEKIRKKITRRINKNEARAFVLFKKRIRQFI